MVAMLLWRVCWTLFQKTKPKEAEKMFSDMRDEHIFKGGMDYFLENKTKISN
jgi:hypothetical protein